ncbi:MAG: hypothetical protein ACLUQK_12785 [Clostridium sp.]
MRRLVKSRAEGSGKQHGSGSITPEIRYFNSANEVQAQLLSKKAAVGLLAEPAATATLPRRRKREWN